MGNVTVTMVQEALVQNSATILKLERELSAERDRRNSAYQAGYTAGLARAVAAVKELPAGTWGDESGERCPWHIAAQAILDITGDG